MNIYVWIRMIFHSLLFLVNLISLTVAAGIVTTLRGQGHKATAGSVLVILATIFYAFLTIGTWSETCIPRSWVSRNRTEAIALPILFLFELIAAIVTTAETSKGTCTDQSLCVALLILSWMSAVTLLVYYLITMVVMFHHFPLHKELWEESPLSYDWFPVPSTSTMPSVPPKDLIVNPPREVAGAPSVELMSVELPPPSFLGHHRPRSSWLPPPPDPERKMQDLGLRAPAGRNAEGNSSRPQGAAHTFGNVPFGSAPAIEDENARFSFSIPRWARKLPTAKRGVETPFPLATGAPFHRSRDGNSHGIDAPVSPTFLQDNEFTSP